MKAKIPKGDEGRMLWAWWHSRWKLMAVSGRPTWKSEKEGFYWAIDHGMTYGADFFRPNKNIPYGPDNCKIVRPTKRKNPRQCCNTDEGTR